MTVSEPAITATHRNTLSLLKHIDNNLTPCKGAFLLKYAHPPMHLPITSSSSLCLLVYFLLCSFLNLFLLFLGTMLHSSIHISWFYLLGSNNSNSPRKSTPYYLRRNIFKKKVLLIMYCLYFLTKFSNLFCMSWKVDCKMSLFRYVMAAGYSRITRRNFGFQLGTKELFKQWNALQIRICFLF